jgi:hypothetical protein
MWAIKLQTAYESDLNKTIQFCSVILLSQRSKTSSDFLKSLLGSNYSGDDLIAVANNLQDVEP